MEIHKWVVILASNYFHKIALAFLPRLPRQCSRQQQSSLQRRQTSALLSELVQGKHHCINFKIRKFLRQHNTLIPRWGPRFTICCWSHLSYAIKTQLKAPIASATSWSQPIIVQSQPTGRQTETNESGTVCSISKWLHLLKLFISLKTLNTLLAWEERLISRDL